MLKRVELTGPQKDALSEARVAFMQHCPFLSHYFFSQLTAYPTRDLETAATDMRRIYFNPDYFAGLRPLERCFVLAHETYHCIYMHPTRMRHYGSAKEIWPGLPFDAEFFNICADWVINAQLIRNKIGICNPEWLHDPAIKGNELVEDVYAARYRKPPKQPQGGQQGQGQPQPGQPGAGNGQGSGSQPAPTDDQKAGKGRSSTYSDKKAKANGGRFDEVLKPETNPVTGAEDMPDDATFKQAVAAAVEAAKSMGKMPGDMQRVVDQILEPQVKWSEHLRMLVSGKIGHNKDTWERPNRRRIVLNPIIYLPGKRGWGCKLVVCVVDNSGSISEHELAAWFGETGGIIQDCRPKRLVVIWCDADVRKVDEANSLDELAHIRLEGSPGGGGTDFRPPFEYISEHGLQPDTLIYLTDMEGRFPSEAPPYPVIWCATTDHKGPFGETVRIKL